MTSHVRSRSLFVSMALTLAVLAVSCGRGGHDHSHPHGTDDHGHSHDAASTQAAPSTQAAQTAPARDGGAMAHLIALGDSGVSGTIFFRVVPDGVRVEARVEGLTPGKHGFHIHETGDCSAPDGKSAGGHFNPGGHDHAGPHADEAHAGDFGNLVASDAGQAVMIMVSDRITIGEGANDILGKAVIIHAGEDDLTSQPSGAAGARIACGVIEGS